MLNLLGSQITFVSNKHLINLSRVPPSANSTKAKVGLHLNHLVVRISIDFIHPLLHIVETLLICYVIDYNDPVCPSVIRRRYGSKSLLTRRIPYLKLNSLAIKLKSSNFEIDADCTDVALGISIVGKSKQKARFADTRISNQEKLEKIITGSCQKTV